MPVTALRTVLLALAVLAGLVVMAAPAAAHGQLAESTPADGSTVEKPLTSVSLYCTEPPALDATFDVRAPDGTEVDAGWAYGETRRLREPVQELFLEDGVWVPRFYDDGYAVTIAVSHLPVRGDYTASYSTVSSDGEEVQGSVTFSYDGELTSPDSGAQPLPPPSVRPPLPGVGRTEQQAQPVGPSAAASPGAEASGTAIAPVASERRGGGATTGLVVGVGIALLLAALVLLRLRVRRAGTPVAAPSRFPSPARGAGTRQADSSGSRKGVPATARKHPRRR